MGKAVFFTAILFCTLGVMAQSKSENYNLTQGAILELGEPSGFDYSNIDFPRRHIIIKRGAVANFKDLIGKKLVIHEMETLEGGAIIAVLKRRDGLNFFRFFPEVKANLSKAIESGELKTTDFKGRNAIAQQ